MVRQGKRKIKLLFDAHYKFIHIHSYFSGCSEILSVSTRQTGCHHSFQESFSLWTYYINRTERPGKDICKIHTYIHIHIYAFHNMQPRGMRVLIKDVHCVVLILIIIHKPYLSIPRTNTKQNPSKTPNPNKSEKLL